MVVPRQGEFVRLMSDMRLSCRDATTQVLNFYEPRIACELRHDKTDAYRTFLLECLGSANQLATEAFP